MKVMKDMKIKEKDRKNNLPVLDVKPLSEEWFALRAVHITASEASIILDVNPYENVIDLWKLKKGLIPTKSINCAMKHGLDTENDARQLFNKNTGLNMTPLVVESLSENWLMASLDGYDHSTQSLVEIKCPKSSSSKTWVEFFEKGVIPAYYYAQVQTQIQCCKAKKAYFMVYINERDFKCVEVQPDHDWVSNALPQLKAFKELLDLPKNPFVFDNPKDVDMSNTLISIRQQIKALEEKEKMLSKALANRLTDLHKSSNLGNFYKKIIVGNVGVVKTQRQTWNFKKFIADQKLTIPREYCSITESIRVTEQVDQKAEQLVQKNGGSNDEIIQ